MGENMSILATFNGKLLQTHEGFVTGFPLAREIKNSGSNRGTVRVDAHHGWVYVCGTNCLLSYRSRSY